MIGRARQVLLVSTPVQRREKVVPLQVPNFGLLGISATFERLSHD